MFKSVRSRRNLTSQTEIQMTPLIDMMFILLIFFVVTTSFISGTGLNIERPQSSTKDKLPRENITIEIDANGRIYVENQRVGLLSLKPFLQRKLRIKPEPAVVIAADKSNSVEKIVSIMDEIRSAGINEVALATTQKY